MTAIENQGRLLQEFTQTPRNSISPREPPQVQSLVIEDGDLEMMSRKDVSWTPITGSDKILEWAVFPPEKPVPTLPMSAYEPKPNPFSHRKSLPLTDTKGLSTGRLVF